METNAQESASLHVLERKVDALGEQLALLLEHQRRQQELIDEVLPILREIMRVGITKLDALEQRGYFAFAQESLHLLDALVVSTPPEELRQLGESLGRILRAVKALTQPEVLDMAAQAAQALQHPHAEDAPKGLLGMLKASHDDDVRRGMAVMLEGLRYLGKASVQASAPAEAPRAPRALLGARRLAAPQAAAPQPAPPRRAAAPPPAPAACAAPSQEGADPTWTEARAEEIARALGLGGLSEAHWAVIRFAREDFAAQGRSPNVRRLAQGSGLPIKEIYTLFPKAPGVMAAQVAGIPKPVGCI